MATEPALVAKRHWPRRSSRPGRQPSAFVLFQGWSRCRGGAWGLGALAVLGMLTGVGFSAELRIGMIGLDTSHVVAFTDLLNDSANREHVPGGRVVAAFKGGSPDLEASWSRVEGYTRTLQNKYGVRIVDSIERLCQQVDVVMLESVDGRPHLEQAKPVFRAGKPIFIDKPVAGSLRDAFELYRLARQFKVPCFSSSSLRYYPGLVALEHTNVGQVRGAVSTGPAPREPHHPDLFWYGIHPAEALFAVLGPGCERVVRTTTPDTDVVTGVWRDGKVGTLIGIRNAVEPYRVTLFGTKAVVDQTAGGDYVPLVREIMKFFQTGVAPVPPEETLELYTFMEAADQSKRLGGQPVLLEEVRKNNGG